MKKNSNLVRSIKLPLTFLVIIWAVHVVTHFLHIDLTQLGVFPRRLSGLKGIFFSPFIHADFGHLISNSTPLFVLSALTLFFYKRVAIPAFLLIFFLSGAAVWAFARPAYHIGASGFIYGLVAFVFWNGVFRKNIKSVALALIVVFYYGSMIFGILPLNSTISWEGHLFGAIAGIIASYWFMDLIETDEKKPVYSWETEPPVEKQYFLDRDTFEQTKEQRRKKQGWDFQDWTSTRT